VDFCPGNSLWNLCIILGLLNLFFFKWLVSFAHDDFVWIIRVWVDWEALRVHGLGFINRMGAGLGMLTFVGVD
jgi:hypothetical protein